MRSIRVEEVTEAVARLYREAACSPDPGLEAALRAGREREESEAGRSVLDDLLANLSLSRQSGSPPCQDTGTAVVFIELGQEVRLEGGDLSEAVDEGVRRAVRDLERSGDSQAGVVAVAGRHADEPTLDARREAVQAGERQRDAV